ncbi:MAG: hypothetical protein ACLFM1_04085 [Bacteroidales bacterium]
MNIIRLIIFAVVLIPFASFANDRDRDVYRDSLENVFGDFVDHKFVVTINAEAKSMNLQFYLNRSANLDFMIYDDRGNLLRQMPLGNKPAGPRQLVLPVDELSPGDYKVQLFAEGINLTDWISLKPEK